ncbi:trafficking protein particle complex subunit 31 [Trichomonascus vanleenenianus]|uniref:TRAPP subunit TRS31 n=1 Tax=Trichomonascus vanleenenianus TaxID=2268995 RepID=UPI003EC99CB3
MMSNAIPGPSTPIIPSSRPPPPIPRTPSSTLPHPSTTPRPSSISLQQLRRPNIYEKNLNRRSGDVSTSSFAFLFSEIVQYLQKQSSGIQDLEQRLNRLGYHIGQRALELVTLREGSKNAKRETKILGVLQFINTVVWKTVFGKPADALEKSNDNPNEYMIIDVAPMITQFISVPKEKAQLNCAALAAGVIEAVLDGSLFTASVTAHTVETDEHPQRTVFLVKFDPSVIEREGSV